MRLLPCLALSLAAFLPGAVRAADDSKELASKALKILDARCNRCHSGAKLNGNFDVRIYKSLFNKADPLDTESEKAKKEPPQYVVAKDVAKSYIWDWIKDDKMPQTKEKLSAEEKKVIKDWIEAGAPEVIVAEKARTPISLLTMLTAISKHLQEADEDDQPYLRYFVMANEYNDPRVKEADLRMYQAALSKAINSLTWKRNIVLPKAVDDAGTIFAIDLRDLDWDAKPKEPCDMWQAMMKYYPYALDHTSSRDAKVRKVAKEIADKTSAKLIYMRADWFVATATREVLYHTILRLPVTAPELETKLGVDVESNFKRGRLWRSGFKSSGVSAQNRMIERHDSLYGSYWKSYDFKVGGARSNLTRFPLGPDFSKKQGYKYPFPYKDAAFVHDGGEGIFNLPNGLQAYFLLDGKDGRIDSGPIAVVHDELKTSGTPEIVTGVSCMTCHCRGLIPSKSGDVIREGANVYDTMRDKVLRLYPTNPVMKQKIKEDSELYLAAVEKATSPFLLTKENKDSSVIREGEPVGKWARKYRLDDLTLGDVAYELGTTPAKLRDAIEANSRLKKDPLNLSVLLVEGGTLKRAEWEGVKSDNIWKRTASSSPYQLAANELGLGVPLDE